MKTINNLKTLSLVSGAAIALSLAGGTVQAADNNPFGMSKLDKGYQVAMEEGKCGGKKSMEKEAMTKEAEGKCGGSKAMEKEAEGKCGGAKAKEAEGKCGGSKAMD